MPAFAQRPKKVMVMHAVVWLKRLRENHRVALSSSDFHRPPAFTVQTSASTRLRPNRVLRFSK